MVKIASKTNAKIIAAQLLLLDYPAMPEREIAKKTGLTRAQVVRIKNGALDRIRAVEKCPRCFAVVAMPCLACGMRDRKLLAADH